MTCPPLAAVSQASLFGESPSVVELWEQMMPPVRYEQQWRQLRRAAEAAQLSPIDLAAVNDNGASGFDRLVEARRWKGRTAVLYAKVASYGGIQVQRLITPEPTVSVRSLSPLTVLRDDAGILEVRAVAWCTLAFGWPASIDDWRRLQLVDVVVQGGDVVVCGRRVRGAATAWNRWLQARTAVSALARSPHALCTVRDGHFPDEMQGNAFSRRGLQAAFGRHVSMVRGVLQETNHPDASAYGDLSYDSVRRLIITSGVEAVERGRSRAQQQNTRGRPPGSSNN